MPIELVCLDADDTLWANMRFFAAAEEAFAAPLAPFDAAGVARTRLAEVELRNLAHYGYGAKSFMLSMIETALALGGDTQAVSGILAAGRTLLAHPVELLPGVEAALDRLARHARLVLVTKGDLLHQEAKLAASGLGGRFAGVEIVSDKTPDTFRQLFARHGVAPERALMAGDSMRSDVLPALAAGAWGVLIPQPGGWAHEAAPAPVGEARFVELASLEALAVWVEERGSREQGAGSR